MVGVVRVGVVMVGEGVVRTGWWVWSGLNAGCGQNRVVHGRGGGCGQDSGRGWSGL